jgi:hypothetical protein
MVYSATWDTSLDITEESIELLVTERGKEVLYAQFTGRPVHPRALPFILEGLALWSGRRLCVVIYADRAVHPLLGLGRVGDDWPDDNPLVEYLFVERPPGDLGGREGRS